MLFKILSLLSAVACIGATPLDDYVWKEDSNYGWVDMVRNGGCSIIWSNLYLRVLSTLFVERLDPEPILVS